jgi:pilus assembly protein CpaF
MAVGPARSESGKGGRRGADPGQAKKGNSDLAPYVERIKPLLLEAFEKDNVGALPRPELALRIGQIVTDDLGDEADNFNLLERRTLVSNLIDWLVRSSPLAPAPGTVATKAPEAPPRAATGGAVSHSAAVDTAKERIQPLVMERLDLAAASQLPREELSQQVGEIVTELLAEEQIRLNGPEQSAVVDLLLNDMLGLGPLEPLLADELINDIMVNGANQVYVERRGKLELTDVRFRDDPHVLNICRRIVSQVGRRIDETTPLCDARLKDGSRVNIIIPPLAIDGPSISIRKFAKKGITLDVMAKQGNISPDMCTVLKIAARSRVADDRPGRAHRDDRGRRRIAAAAAARGAPRDPTRQPGRSRRHIDARPGQEFAAYAPRPDHPRRGTRLGSGRPASGHEHRPRRLARHDPRQPAPRSPD